MEACSGSVGSSARGCSVEAPGSGPYSFLSSGMTTVSLFIDDGTSGRVVTSSVVFIGVANTSGSVGSLEPEASFAN